jgi:prephenate dehydratase
MAALEMLGEIELLACEVSADVFAALMAGEAEAAVLPIENSLHGSVAEHYDLLLHNAVRLERESLLRIRHNLITAPGVRREDLRVVLSHPVALSQCRRYLASLRGVRALPFYDTAGSVKHVMAEGLRDTAAVAPELAAKEYGAEVLVAGIEDHAQNFTRFHLVRRADDARQDDWEQANKLTAAFVVEHRPGTLVAALDGVAQAGVDLTKIESRPVPGKPWEYVFYVEFRFADAAMAARALEALRAHSSMVKELGRYRAA